MSVRSPPAKPGNDTCISSPSTSPVRPPTNTTASAARAASSASSNGGRAPGKLPRQPDLGVALGFEVLKLQADRLAGLERHVRAARASSRRGRPLIDHGVPVHPQPEPIVTGHGELVVARRRWNELTGPSRREIVVAHRVVRGHFAASHHIARRRSAIPLELDGGIGACQHWRSRHLASAEVLAAQSVNGRPGIGPQVRGVDGRERVRILPAFDEVSAARVITFVFGPTACRMPASAVTGADGVP
jgi:hypothetical protein